MASYISKIKAYIGGDVDEDIFISDVIVFDDGDGQPYIQEWNNQSKPKPTDAQLDALDATASTIDATKALAKLRSVRDSKLSQTDWWAGSDLTMTQAQTDYRQALRDITNTYSDLNTVVWPTKP